MSKTAWDPQVLQREILRWTGKPVFLKMNWTDAVASVREQLRPGIAASAFLPPLNNISLWEGMNGALAVLNGDAHGWERLAKSALYRYWYFRILFHRFDIDPRPQKRGAAYCVEVAHCLAHLIVNRWTEQAEWLGRRLVAGFTDGAVSAWPGTPFEPFMACLYCRWQGSTMGDGVPGAVDLGVYSAVLNSLEGDDEAQFANALADACDYHASRIDDPHDSGYPEFYHPIYNVFPAEILAIQIVRRLLGYKVPDQSHLILHNPLAFPPADMPTGVDELLVQVVDKAKSLWPDL